MNAGEYVRCVRKEELAPGLATPSVTTLPASDISANRATLNASLDSTGGLNVYNRGFIWSENNNPTLTSNDSFIINKYFSASPFSQVVHDFFPNKTYYYRAYAINDAGITYGDILSFTTPDPCLGVDSVDYQGHTYPTVGIGTQCWFKENLKTDKFSNNDPIPLVLGGSLPWRTLTDIAYTSYQDNSTYQAAYGNLYSYYAILDPRGICPPGWKVPTESDFLTLVNYISPRTPLSLTSCSMLDHPSNPSCSTNIHPYWPTNLSIQGDDHYGFSAVPGGRIWGGTNSTWSYFGTYSYFATQNLKYFRLYLGPSHSLNSANMNAGEYVRCVKE